MSTTSPTTALAGRYLTLVLDQEAYAIRVEQVREIIRVPPITPMPQMPAYVKGVINLRGRVIPVIDLRARFGLRAEILERTCIIVVQVQRGAGPVPMGLIVDSVEDVSRVGENDLAPAPDFGTQVDTRYLLGLAKSGGRVRILLDIDRAVAPSELAAVG